MQTLHVNNPYKAKEIIHGSFGNQGKEIKALLNIFHNDSKFSTKNHEKQTFKNPEIEPNRTKRRSQFVNLQPSLPPHPIQNQMSEQNFLDQIQVLSPNPPRNITTQSSWKAFNHPPKKTQINLEREGGQRNEALEREGGRCRGVYQPLTDATRRHV